MDTSLTLLWSVSNLMTVRCNIPNTRDCFIGKSEHREEKYDAQRSFLDEIRGVWIADECRVFDTSSKSKQRLRSKRRSEIVKINAN